MNKSRDDFAQNLRPFEKMQVQAEKPVVADGQDELRSLQLLELNVLKTIVSICDKNNFQYFLAEGTLLGAIRHKGFIPWDDDVDVCMPREDYERFIEIASEELPNGYTSCQQSDTGVWGTLRISDTNHEICRTLDGKDLHLFVSVDIFPIDGFPNGRLKQWLHWMNIMRRYCLFRAARIDRLDKNKKRGLFLRAAIKLLMLLPIGKLINEKKALQRLTDTLIKYSFSASNATISFYSEYTRRSIRIPSTVMPKSCWGNGRSALFEGEQLRIPNEAEKILSKEYGDYMTLPPVEERTAKHSMKLI